MDKKKSPKSHWNKRHQSPMNFLTVHDCSMVQVSTTVHHGMPLVPAHHMTLWTRAPWMPTSHKDISDAYEEKRLVQEPNGGYLANAKACQDRCCVLTKLSCVQPL